MNKPDKGSIIIEIISKKAHYQPNTVCSPCLDPASNKPVVLNKRL